MYRIRCRFVALLTLVLGVAGTATFGAAPQKSEDNVKFTVKADKDIVMLTVEIAKGWHLYANPVANPDLLSSQTVVTFTSGGKPITAKVEYPEGKLVKDAVVGDYKVYEGTITIKATLEGAGAGPVEATVAVQTCNDTSCLLPSKVKVPVK
jgi:thiol:disulfide interchange protein